MEGVEPVMRAVPALGQHTEGILEELDFARGTIEAWRAAGVI
jgi:crotonobetainyl-CoA:carnitine CoA-transferase CaiB-like acyl-CoA transferase